MAGRTQGSFFSDEDRHRHNHGSGARIDALAPHARRKFLKTNAEVAGQVGLADRRSDAERLTDYLLAIAK